MAKGKRRRKGRGKGQTGFPWRLVLGVFIFAITLVPFFATYLYLLIMMGPTWVAYVVDRSPQKFLTRSVGSVNVCGALPGLIEIWIQGFMSVETLTAVLSNVYYWLYAYGAASIGWLLFTMVPRGIASFVSLKAKNRIEELRRRQAKLVDEWGEDVTQEVQRSLDALESMGMEDGEGALPPPPSMPENETGEPPASLGDIGDLPEFDDRADKGASEGSQRAAG